MWNNGHYVHFRYRDDSDSPPIQDLEEQYVQCISCGDLYRYDELTELGFCPGCEEELREVENK